MIDRRTFLAATLASSSGIAMPVFGAQYQRSYRAWEVGPKGDFDTLRMVEREQRTPGSHEAVVKVIAGSLNARDQAVARGWFLEDKPASRIPLTSGCGEVLAVGEHVTRVAPGDRVTCAHFAHWVDGPWDPVSAYDADVGNTIDGWLSEQVTLPAPGLVKLPDSISNDTGASIAGAGVTAWHALYEAARVKPGDTVLSLGTGGVSTWGVMLAKMSGAKVVVTSSSDKKLARMRTMGADITVNYEKVPDWGNAIMELTNGKGVDIVLENVGRRTLDQSLQACNNNATVILIGTGRLPERLPKMPGYYIKNISMKAISNASRRMLEDMVVAISTNDMNSVIDRRFVFDDAPDAFRYMATSKHLGKILIDV